MGDADKLEANSLLSAVVRRNTLFNLLKHFKNRQHKLSILKPKGVVSFENNPFGFGDLSSRSLTYF